MKKVVGVVDTGVGNILGVSSALAKIGFSVERITNPIQLSKLESVVLPGVGSFEAGMRALESCGFSRAILNFDGERLLGICLGMQLLFSTGTEGDGCNGIGALKGSVLPLSKFTSEPLRIPNTGWRPVHDSQNMPIGPMYFTHSYYCEPDENEIVRAKSKWGQFDFTVAVQKDNFFGVQFHPEKSGTAGLRLLESVLTKSKI